LFIQLAFSLGCVFTFCSPRSGGGRQRLLGLVVGSQRHIAAQIVVTTLEWAAGTLAAGGPEGIVRGGCFYGFVGESAEPSGFPEGFIVV
jgi:hypothetical protein